MLVSLHKLVISRLGIERRLSPKKHLRVTCKLRSQSRQFTFVRRIRKTRVAPLNPSHFHRRLVQATATTDGRQLLTHVDVHLRANAATNRAALHLVARARRAGRPTNWPTGNSQTTVHDWLGLFLFFWGQCADGLDRQASSQRLSRR